MRFSINIQTDADISEDDLRDRLATLVEDALALLPGEHLVGTTR